MLNSLDVQNFKSIKGKYFPLRNLNILLGLNGMGKSSLIQLLLAFRQTKLAVSQGSLYLNGELTKIGNTKDALYQYAKNTPFSVKLSIAGLPKYEFIFDYKLEADFFTAKNFKQISVNEPKSPFKIESLFNQNFQYLAANRQEPRTITNKDYSQVVIAKNIGNFGEHTAHYLESFGDNDIVLENLIHLKSRIRDEITNQEIVIKTLINQVNLWMGEISPNVNIRTTSISSDNVMLEYVYKQPNLGETNRFKPENVGFGITYGLPVVVALLKAKPGDLVIIENPESHIHPKGQAELGKMIALAAMSGVQLIIETHSDHLVNGIRVAIKENQLDKDKAIVFYFEKEIKADEQYSKITNIEIDQNGEFSEYPTDMMDEWNNQLMKLL